MKLPQLFLLLFLLGCGAIPSPVDDDPEPAPRSRSYNFPCDISTSSTDWVYCDPVSFDLSGLSVEQIIVNYSVRITRGDDLLEAELYDLKNNKTVPLTRVESVIGYIMHNRKTPNIAGYLNHGPQELTIRFRVNKPSAVGFLSNNSRLEIAFSNP